VRAQFVELPAFERFRAEYLDDEAFRELQRILMTNPAAGAVIQGSGGLRKLRMNDGRRGKGKRGGLRVIYYWWEGGSQFWLFAVYDKDTVNDLSRQQLRGLREMVKAELAARFVQ